MHRRLALGLLTAASALTLLSGCSKQDGSTPNSSEKPKADGAKEPSAPKSQVRVGFSQIGAESDWRKANTESIQAEAKKRGIDLQFVDAQQKQENQIKALRSFIVQDVDVIAFSPVVETGWEPVLKEIKDAGIPVVLTDRAVDVSDPDLFVTFIGADFVEEDAGRGSGWRRRPGGNAKIAELQGTPGSAPAIDRKKGFEEIIAGYPGLQIIKSQTGEFTRAKGREVMESFLKSPEGKDITALFSHNDDMALGAIQAIEEAGLKPGVDIKIVSIDGVHAAFEAMVAGKLNCTVECNPLLGPQLFDAVEAIVAGKPVEKRIVTKEGVFTQETAAEDIKTRQY
ncbi:MAG: ABC transporter substrate-binding protein [Phycisphaerales bacterium]|nr:ABC transporter substrate-binding protein [Phycisphaerales bacterium]